MKIRRSEEINGVFVEVQLTDWPREDESQEVFEQRMLGMVNRLMTLQEQPAETEEGEEAEQ